MNKAANTIPAPKGKRVQFFTNLSFYDIVIALAALIAAGGALYLAAQETDPNKRIVGYIIFGTAVVVFLANVVKASLQWRERSEKQSTHELEGCLFTLHAVLVTPLDSQAAIDAAGLRLTIHVPKGDNKNLVQLIDYVGTPRKNKMKTAGRLISIHCGITGQAFRTGSPFRLLRNDESYESYLKELVENQGFTEEQAKLVDRSTQSGYALPLVGEKAVMGIVYADATQVDFFTTERTETIKSACIGIAQFVGQRY